MVSSPSNPAPSPQAPPPEIISFFSFFEPPPPPPTHLGDSILYIFLPNHNIKHKVTLTRMTYLVDGNPMLTVFVPIKTAMLCKKFTLILQVGAYNPTPDSPFK